MSENISCWLDTSRLEGGTRGAGVVAIDPGPERSAWVHLDARTLVPLKFGIWENRRLLGSLREAPMPRADIWRLVVEMVSSYGMPVGKDVFETVLWIGRFIEAWQAPYSLIYRRTVKLLLCGTARAKDTNVRQAVIDLYPASGGGKTPQVGTKKKPGPLYGISKDVWQALAVGIAWVREAKENPDHP